MEILHADWRLVSPDPTTLDFYQGNARHWSWQGQDATERLEALKLTVAQPSLPLDTFFRILALPGAHPPGAYFPYLKRRGTSRDMLEGALTRLEKINIALVWLETPDGRDFWRKYCHGYMDHPAMAVAQDRIRQILLEHAFLADHNLVPLYP